MQPVQYFACQVYDAKFSGDRVVTCGEDSTVRIWDSWTGSGNSSAVVWDISKDSNEEVCAVRTEDWIRHVGFWNDFLVTVTEKNILDFWSTSSGDLVASNANYHDNMNISCAALRGDRTLTLSYCGKLSAWEHKLVNGEINCSILRSYTIIAAGVAGILEGTCMAIYGCLVAIGTKHGMINVYHLEKDWDKQEEYGDEALHSRSDTKTFPCDFDFRSRSLVEMNLDIPPDALAINQAQNAGKTPEESNILKAKNYKLPGLTRYREGAMKETFYFVQVVSPNFGRAAYPEENCDVEKRNMEKLICSVNNMEPKPRFVVVCGNFTHCKPDEKEYFQQVESFKASFDTLKSEIPVICVCGRNEFDKEPISQSIESYRRNFGEDWFAFWIEGVQFVVLNSLYYGGDIKDCSDFISEQNEWLESVLLEAQVNPPQFVVVIQNTAWFVSNSSEPDNNNNIDLTTRQNILPKMREANVKAILSGAQTGSAKDGEIEAVQSSPFNEDGIQRYRIFKIKSDSIQHNVFTLDNSPQDLNNAFS
ncbi:hypothetical protein QZH41_007320 [Actinostola sp. cb2023]|nr:hypothetical protein QZH41_007320 [Actinostola sp. cb2023]